MTSDIVQNNMTVLINEDQIVYIGKADEFSVPAGARIVDGRDRWLMPGLADAHAHLVVTIGANEEQRAQWQNINYRLLLLGLSQGVTTVVEMGGVGLGPDPDGVLPELRQYLNSALHPGPTVYLASAKANDSEMTRAQGIKFVESAIADGYDLIKVYNALSRDGYRGIMLRAEQLGIPVVGHVVRSIGLEGTLGSGQRSIAHLEEYLYTYFPFRVTDTLQVAAQGLDPAAIPYLAEMTKKSGIWITPTLVTSEMVLAQAENLDSVLARPEVRYIPGELYEALWAPGVNPYSSRFSHPKHVLNLRASLEFQRHLVRAFHKEGVSFVVGSDAPAAGVVPGYALHDELRNLVAAGLSPFEALAAATRNTADYLGTDRFGLVEVGKRADLLLLNGNPLTDITNTKKIAGVMASGQWLSAIELQALVEEPN